MSEFNDLNDLKEEKNAPRRRRRSELLQEDDGLGGVPEARENETEELSGVSVVACRYGVGEDGGIVAVIGPTRMDYTKALSAVKIASKTLGE